MVASSGSSTRIDIDDKLTRRRPGQWPRTHRFFEEVTASPRTAAKHASPGGLSVIKAGQDGESSGDSPGTLTLMNIRSQKCSRSCRECVYASPPAEEASDHATAIAWIESIDSVCRAWRDAGEIPFPQLMVPSSLDWHGLDARGLRYFYFLASVGDVLEKNNTRKFCLWWKAYDVCATPCPYSEHVQLMQTRGLQIAAQVDYVAYAQIVVAADRLGKTTKLASVMEDAEHYKVLALKGLRQALASFSRENSDGVLAASISLMFQQQTPADWQRVTQGTAAVIKSMRPWIRTSAHWPILKHICQVEKSPEAVMKQEDTSFYDERSPSLVTVHSITAAVEFLLEQGITALNRLAACTRNRKELSTTVRSLADMLRLAQEKHLTGQKHDPFWLAHPFCDLNNRESIAYAEIDNSNPFVLVVLAHMYSALVVLAMLYPELDSAGIIAIRVYSLDALARHFHDVVNIDCEVCHERHGTKELLAFPWNALRAYRQWQVDQQTCTSEDFR